MKITIKKLMEVRKYYRDDFKRSANSIIEDILLNVEPDRRYWYNFDKAVNDYCESIIKMDLEDILFKAGIFNSEQEIDI